MVERIIIRNMIVMGIGYTVTELDGNLIVYRQNTNGVNSDVSLHKQVVLPN